MLSGNFTALYSPYVAFSLFPTADLMFFKMCFNKKRSPAIVSSWVIGDLCIGLTVQSSSLLISRNSQQAIIQEIYLCKLMMHCDCYFFVNCLRPKIREKLHYND